MVPSRRVSDSSPVGLRAPALNLIMNAIEAMELVQDRDRILMVRSVPRGAEVLVNVEDSGAGIAPAAMEQIFDAFYTTKSNGMGMGLSICKSIVESHGGRLWATAARPHGSIFHVALPSANGGAARP